MAINVTKELREKLHSINLIEFMQKEYNVEFVSVSYDSARGRCPHPDHDDHKPSFYVRRTQDGGWTWTCFACHSGSKDLNSNHKNYGSDIMAFVQWMSDYRGSNHVYTFHEAAAKVAKYIGIDTGRQNNIYSHKLEVNASVARGCHKYLVKNRGVAYSYLTGRGLDEKDMSDWLIGYNGDRVVFPFVDKNKDVIGFTMRVVKDNNTGSKYINSRSSDIFDKSSYLYGIDKVDTTKDYLIITEGQMDAIAAYKYGLYNTVATSGTCFTEKHAEMLEKGFKNIKKLIFIYDGDAAGKSGFERSASIARKHGYMVSVFNLSDGYDLFDFMMENKEAGVDIILSSSVPYFYEELKDDVKQFDTLILNFQAKIAPKINSLLMTTTSEEEKLMIKSFIHEKFSIRTGGGRDDYIETC